MIDWVLLGYLVYFSAAQRWRTFQILISWSLTYLLVGAFLVYVRSVVEYNSIISSPSTARDIDAVESVENRFTKRLPTLKKTCLIANV